MLMGLQVVLLDELSMEFHCDLQLLDRSRIVNGVASGAGGGVADRVLEEVSHEMRFFLHFGASDFPSKNPFKKCFKIRVVLLCFATQSLQIT